MKLVRIALAAVMLGLASLSCGKPAQNGDDEQTVPENPAAENPGTEEDPLEKILSALPSGICVNGNIAELSSSGMLSQSDDYELWFMIDIDGTFCHLMLAMSHENDGQLLELHKSDPLAERQDGSWMWSIALYDKDYHLVSNILWGGPADDGGLLASEGSLLRMSMLGTSPDVAEFDIKGCFPLEMDGQTLDFTLNLTRKIPVLRFL